MIAVKNTIEAWAWGSNPFMLPSDENPVHRTITQVCVSTIIVLGFGALFAVHGPGVSTGQWLDHRYSKISTSPRTTGLRIEVPGVEGSRIALEDEKKEGSAPYFGQDNDSPTLEDASARQGEQGDESPEDDATIGDEEKSGMSAFALLLLAMLVVIFLAVFAVRVIDWRYVAGLLVAAGTGLLGLWFYLEQTWADTVYLQQAAMLQGIFWVQIGILCVLVMILFNQNK
jgi:hypothetical protein